MKARTELENYRGTDLVSLNLHHTLRRAHEGRVSYLLLRQDAEQRGTWDEETQQVQTGGQLGRDEDLLNLAAIATRAPWTRFRVEGIRDAEWCGCGGGAPFLGSAAPA
jgi:hypothetical protein